MIGEFNTLNALINKLEGAEPEKLHMNGLCFPMECRSGTVLVLIERRRAVRAQLLEWSIEPASRGDPHDEEYVPAPPWGRE